MAYYAIRNGRETGICNSWGMCQKSVKGYKGAEFKKFNTLEECNEYLNGTSPTNKQEKTQCKPDELIAYVDGSYMENKNPKVVGFGIVYITHEGRTVEISEKSEHPSLVAMRNVGGELSGALYSTQQAVASGYKRIYLHYDYEGIAKWITGEWKCKNEATKQYKEEMDKLKGNIDIEFIKVDAHTGVEFNEKADQLAKRAITG